MRYLAISFSALIFFAVFGLAMEAFAAPKAKAKETAAEVQKAISDSKTPWKTVGRVLDIGTSNLLYNYERTEVFDGVKSTVTKKYSYPDGKLAVEETVNYENGRLVKWVQNHKQLEATGELEIVNGEAKFKYTKEGKTKDSTEKFVDNFVTSDEIHPYLVKNWETIARGDNVSIRLAVLDRRETVGFKFFKTEEVTRPDGKKIVVVKMKPTSFIIAALVDPLHFKFEADGDHKLVEVAGRTIPKIQRDGKWKDLDAILAIDKF